MKISKSDFKIIFNKIISNSNDKNMQILQNLSNNYNSGDYQIDNLVNTYSSEYISKIMNKILKNSQIGGETSEESKKNTSILDLTETSIQTPNFINIIDAIGGADKVSTNIFYDKILPFLKRDNTKSNLTSSELPRIASETSRSSRSTYEPSNLKFNTSPVYSETSPLESMQSIPLSPTSSKHSQSLVNSETSPLESMQSRPLSPTSSKPRQSKWSLFRSPVNSATSPLESMQSRPLSPTSSEPRQSKWSLFRSPVNSATSPLESMQSRPLSPTSSEPRQSKWSLFRSPVNSATSPLGSMQSRPLSPTSSEPRLSPVNSATSPLESMQFRPLSPTSSEPKRSNWKLLRSRLKKSPDDKRSRPSSSTSSESNYFIQSHNVNQLLTVKDKLLKEKDDEIQLLKDMLAQIKIQKGIN